MSNLARCLLLLAVALATSHAATRPPNVVVFLADDQGWGDLSINGNRDLKTPRIDSLAKDGVRLKNFFVSPVCSPTRAEFLTGRYHPRGGVYSTSKGGERLNLDETTIADVFKKAGYHTAAFGKWHNGMQFPYHPNGRGFDEFYGFCSGHWGHYFGPMLEHNGRLVEGEGFCIDDFTNRAMQFIEQNREQPFFLYLAYNTPHSPMQVPDAYWNRFKEKELKFRHPGQKDRMLDHTRCALAMCENIDWNVGRVLDRLETLGLEDNTIVVYFSDNGPNGLRWIDGLRGIKGSTDEGGVKSPLHIRYPGTIPAGVEIEPISSVCDLLPTLTSLASIPCETAKPLDGRSLISLLRGKCVEWPDRIVPSFWGNKISIRSQTHRLDFKGRLYNMIEDPGQTLDISEQQPEITAALKQAAQHYRETVLTERPNTDKRSFIVGHPRTRYTQLPARDASASGGIQRSSRHPNCSFYTHWTQAGESIRWEAEVPQAGRFKATVYYTCAKADLGSRVALRAGHRQLEFRIAEAHDPPRVGMDQDRFPRTESYVKDFLPLEVGVLELDPGSQTIALEALTVPGSQVMDFRLLMLERLP